MTDDSSIKYYLYHKISPLGLNYLGYTSKNPYKYKGSGKRWKSHILKHGFGTQDIITIVLLESYDKNEIKNTGLHYSRLYDIVNSPDWANLIDESANSAPPGRKLSLEAIAKIAASRQGFRHSEETKRKLSVARKGKCGPRHSEETKRKIRGLKLGRTKPGVAVRNIISGEIFDSVRRAAKSIGVAECTLAAAIRDKKPNCQFEYNDPNYIPPYRPSNKGRQFSDQARANMKNNNKMALKVRHLKTGLIFDSITEAAIWHGLIKRDTLNAQLKNNRKCEFEYYNESIIHSN